MRNLLLSASLLALTCTAASAGSITIGLQEDAGATQQFSGGSNFAITGASTPDFQVNNISASTVPTLTMPPIFDSNALDVRQDSGAAHTLHVFITAQGLMSPAALADLIIISSFSTNSLRMEWTVTETTLFDQGNGINSGTVVGLLVFGAQSGSADQIADRFDITITTPDGTFGPYLAPNNDNLDIQNVPNEFDYYHLGSNFDSIFNGAMNGKL